MNTQKRIDKLTEELLDIYRNTNEGPRLIAEMVEREFPESLDLASKVYTDRIEWLESEIEDIKESQDEEE